MKKVLITLVAVVVIVGGAFYFLRPAKNTSGPQTHEVMLHIEGIELVSGPEVLEVKKGDTVEITVMADTEDEFHLHGYDRSIDIGPDREPTLTLVADTAGRFIAELEGSETEIFVLEVMP